MLLNRFEKFCIHCEHTLLSLYGLYIQDHWKIQVDVLWEQILKGQYSLKLKYLHLSHFIKLNIQVKKFINKLIANNCIFWIMKCLIIPQRILLEQFKRSVFKKLGRALEIEIVVVRKQVFVRFMLLTSMQWGMVTNESSLSEQGHLMHLWRQSSRLEFIMKI